MRAVTQIAALASNNLRHVARRSLAVYAAAVLLIALVITSPATATARASADPTVIPDWNAIAVTTFAGDPTKAPNEGFLYLGFVHAAVYNAVVGIDGRYAPYRFRARAPSRTTSTWSTTARAMGWSMRMARGVPSRLLPPWLDTISP